MLAAALFLLALAQPYDLLLRGGRVLDPGNGIDGLRDVAIGGGAIAAVAESIDASQAKIVVDVQGLLIVPGLVDLHAHVFFGTEPNADYSGGYNALPPDGFTFRSCVTTVVDTGGSGWRNFPQFKEQVIDRSETRVLALLNIVGSGMKGGPVEQNLSDMDAKLTALRATEFPEVVVGVKVAHYRGAEWDPVDRAVSAGELARIPVMVDFGTHQPPFSLEALLLTHLRPGDLLTHTFAEVDGRVPIVDEAGSLRPYVRKARERGILFDVGHGAGSFVFGQARPAMEQGFPPDTISTDLHRASMNAGMKDMLNVMSKLLSLGMSIEDAVRAATSSAARAIRRDDIGHLAVGAEADVSVLRVREGEFGFVDVSGARNQGTRKLECELTLRAGKVVWDLNGIAASRDE
jgi:dihydroorotase